jgi:uncharacterized membrane protein
MVFIGSLTTVGYITIHRKSQENFTDFYILGAGSKMNNYPSQVTLGNSTTVTLDVENYENQTSTYNIIVTLDGQTLKAIGPFDLLNKQKYTQEISLTPPQAGDNQEVEFLLFKNYVTEPYLELNLWINVTQ